MASVGTSKYDSDGRFYKPVLYEDSSGNKYVPIVDSDAHTQVDVLAITAGDNRIGTVSGTMVSVSRAKAIDASIGAYAAGDVVNDDDCCTTATAWTFANVVRANGAAGIITSALLFNETPNITPRLELHLYNALPTGELMDNSKSNAPYPADLNTWIGKIPFPALDNDASQAGASTAEATPSTTGRLAKWFKCASDNRSIYGILKTLDAFTQVATNDIKITLNVDQY